jgi:Domain of unknown function (DUF222)/HNH endonuclease
MEAHGRDIAARHSALLQEVAEFNLTEAWRGDGAVSMAAWLTERCGVGSATAGIWVRTAGRLESLPHLAAALAEGTLSVDAVASLSEFATPGSDAELASAAVHWTVKQIRELAASHRAPTDAAAARDYEHRSLRFNDAKSTIWAAFTKDDYALVKAALIARVSWAMSDRGGAASGPASGPGTGAEGSSSSATGSTTVGDPLGYVPFDQRLCDAFVSICTYGGMTVSSSSGRSGTGTSGATSGTSGTSGSRSARPGAEPAASSESQSTEPESAESEPESTEPGKGFFPTGRMPGFRPTLVVHADIALLTGLDPDGVAELSGLGRISREVANRLACDAKVILSLEDKDGNILNQKRVKRSPTEAQRIEIARRDKGCRFSSCSFVEFTEVHHVVPWTRGGETNMSNLITLCGRHHHAVHELGWSMKGNADGLMTFEGPHGHRMTSSPSPTWRRPGTAPMRR